MITLSEINQYIESCVSKYKMNFKKNIGDNDENDFLMFKYAPTFNYFETKYGNIKVSKKISTELWNMNEIYKMRCEKFKLESK
jgi:hypothetical protein